MWFLFALFVGGFILASLLGAKMKVDNAKAATLDQFNFPRAKEGDPVPRFYGTVKLNSPNAISLNGFKATAITKKVKTGLFSSKKVTTGYRYKVTVDLAWALGPGVVFRQMWFGENKVWSGCLYTGACFNLELIDWPDMYGGSEDGNRGGISGYVGFYCGEFNTTDQPRDSYLVTTLDANVPAYIGVAHTVFRDFWWGNSPSIDAVSVEAAYFVNNLIPSVDGCKHYMDNALDANPVEVLYDILTYEWGNLGFSSARVDTANWRAAGETVFAEQNGISIIYSSPAEAREAFKNILRQINAIVYEDQTDNGLVKIKLIRSDYVIADLPVLTTGDVLEVKNYTKKLWTETNNVVRVKYISRADNYAVDKIAVAKDSSLLRFQGKERPVEINMPGVKTAAVANMIAARELSNLNVPLFSCEMTISRSKSNVKPGDVFKWVWPEYGITQMIMRVRKIGLGTLEDGTITITVTQDEFSLDDTVVAAPADSLYAPTDTTATDIVTINLMELPAWLDINAGFSTPVGSTRFMSFVEKPGTASINYNGYQEDGTPTDAIILSAAPYSQYATLQTAIGRFDGFSDGKIASLTIDGVSDVDALTLDDTMRLGGSLIAIGSELLAYESFTDMGGGTYHLVNVRRALLDTNWDAHTVGTKIYFFDGQDNFFEEATLESATPTVYFLDHTATDLSKKSTAIMSSLAPVGRVNRVVAPDYLTLDGTRELDRLLIIGDTTEVDARPRNRNTVDQIWFEDDAADTAEAGTTYKLEYEVASVVTLIADDIILPYTMTLVSGMEGLCTFRLSAKKDGLYSIGYSPIRASVGDYITIDSDIVLIDGDGISV